MYVADVCVVPVSNVQKNYAEKAIKEMLGWYGLQDPADTSSSPPAGDTAEARSQPASSPHHRNHLSPSRTSPIPEESSGAEHKPDLGTGQPSGKGFVISSPSSPNGERRAGNRKLIGMRYLFPSLGDHLTLLDRARIWVTRHDYKYFVGWSQDQLQKVDPILRPVGLITSGLYKLHMNRSEYCRNVKLKYCLESDAPWAREFRHKLSKPFLQGGFSGLCQAKIAAAELWRKYSANYKSHQARYPNPKSKYKYKKQLTETRKDKKCHLLEKVQSGYSCSTQESDQMPSFHAEDIVGSYRRKECSESSTSSTENQSWGLSRESLSSAPSPQDTVNASQPDVRPEETLTETNNSPEPKRPAHSEEFSNASQMRPTPTRQCDSDDCDCVSLDNSTMDTGLREGYPTPRGDLLKEMVSLPLDRKYMQKVPNQPSVMINKVVANCKVPDSGVPFDSNDNGVVEDPLLRRKSGETNERTRELYDISGNQVQAHSDTGIQARSEVPYKAQVNAVPIAMVQNVTVPPVCAETCSGNTGTGKQCDIKRGSQSSILTRILNDEVDISTCSNQSPTVHSPPALTKPAETSDSGCSEQIQTPSQGSVSTGQNSLEWQSLAKHEYRRTDRGMSYLFPSLADQQLSLEDKVGITVIRHKNNYFLSWSEDMLQNIDPLVRPKVVVTEELYKKYCHRNAMKYDSNLQFAVESPEEWGVKFRERLSKPPSAGGFHSLCEVKQEAGRMWKEFSGRYRMHCAVKLQMDKNTEISTKQQADTMEANMSASCTPEVQALSTDSDLGMHKPLSPSETSSCSSSPLPVHTKPDGVPSSNVDVSSQLLQPIVSTTSSASSGSISRWSSASSLSMQSTTLACKKRKHSTSSIGSAGSVADCSFQETQKYSKIARIENQDVNGPMHPAVQMLANTAVAEHRKNEDPGISVAQVEHVGSSSALSALSPSSGKVIEEQDEPASKDHLILVDHDEVCSTDTLFRPLSLDCSVLDQLNIWLERHRNNYYLNYSKESLLDIKFWLRPQFVVTNKVYERFLSKSMVDMLAKVEYIMSSKETWAVNFQSRVSKEVEDGGFASVEEALAEALDIWQVNKQCPTLLPAARTQTPNPVTAPQTLPPQTVHKKDNRKLPRRWSASVYEKKCSPANEETMRRLQELQNKRQRQVVDAGKVPEAIPSSESPVHNGVLVQEYLDHAVEQCLNQPFEYNNVCTVENARWAVEPCREIRCDQTMPRFPRAEGAPHPNWAMEGQYFESASSIQPLTNIHTACHAVEEEALDLSHPAGRHAVDKLWHCRDELLAVCRENVALSWHDRLQPHLPLLREKLGQNYTLPPDVATCILDLTMCVIHRELKK